MYSGIGVVNSTESLVRIKRQSLQQAELELSVAWESGKGNSGNPNAPFFRKLRLFPDDELRVHLAWGSVDRLFFFGRQVCLFFFVGRDSFFGLGIGVGFGFGVAFWFF